MRPENKSLLSRFSRNLIAVFSIAACLGSGTSRARGQWLAEECGDAFPPAVDPATCSFKAEVTNDNDIRIAADTRMHGKSADIPAPVLASVRELAKKQLRAMAPEVTRGLECDEIFPATFRIAAPDGRQLFVPKIYSGVGFAFYYLVLYDPKTNVVTQRPPRTFAKWADAFKPEGDVMEVPFVSSADLFRNSRRQIVFEERVHNGSMYDGVVYHYYDVGPHLELIPVLALETKVVPFSFKQADFILERDVSVLAHNRIRIELFKTRFVDPSKRVSLGYESAVSRGPGQPFRVQERHYDWSHLEGFDTWRGIEDPDDLTEAYDFYY